MEPSDDKYYPLTTVNGRHSEDIVDLPTAIEACATDDGRADIEIPPTLSHRLSKIPDFEGLDEAPTQQPAYQAHTQKIIGINVLIRVIRSRGDI
ncbi:uncharacterized protein FTOL_05196 [Fusarium torulosum]|uniref:Uncharacterized protein n=1 Tax=Fusarium torulosum TaxID=33205 RepID=A0AAE8SGU8_9HYPO|nr:uncharacterized protein FTOL_05196 [Fusarium torulosum]